MVTNTKIWLSSPHMSGKELDYVKDAFDSNWIAPLGPNVEGFQQDINEYLGENKFVAALSSGTAAIHLSLILLGVKVGDYVICQSNTFSATANPIKYLGAHPVFVDSERETWNICPILLEDAIKNSIKKGNKPKAIIAVHLYGMPYNVEALKKLSQLYSIPIIEDSAESFGSHYKNKKCGTFGDLAILSFNGNKIITTSGGGALVCNSEKDRDKAVFLATQARDNTPEYTHSHIGYNYRMSNVLAGIGRGQMTVLDDRVRQRRQNYEYYYNKLSHISGLEFLSEPENTFSNRWLSCVLLPSLSIREKIRNLLHSKNIESRPLWKPMHMQPIFQKEVAFVNGVSEDLFNRGLCLPSGSDLTENELNRVISEIKYYFSAQ